MKICRMRPLHGPEKILRDVLEGHYGIEGSVASRIVICVHSGNITTGMLEGLVPPDGGQPDPKVMVYIASRYGRIPEFETYIDKACNMEAKFEILDKKYHQSGDHSLRAIYDANTASLKQALGRMNRRSPVPDSQGIGRLHRHATRKSPVVLRMIEASMAGADREKAGSTVIIGDTHAGAGLLKLNRVGASQARALAATFEKQEHRDAMMRLADEMEKFQLKLEADRSGEQDGDRYDPGFFAEFVKIASDAGCCVIGGDHVPEGTSQ